jgi:hypothetical protein
MKYLTLSDTPFDSFRCIKFKYECLDGNVLGFLRYIRTYHKGYDFEKGDQIDEVLRQALEVYFGEAIVCYKMQLIFNESIEQAKKITDGPSERDVIFNFYQKYKEIDQYRNQMGSPKIKTRTIKLKLVYLTANEEAIKLRLLSEYIIPIEGDFYNTLATIKYI